MHEQFLLFGATGDLAAGQVFPALANLLRDRLLPANFRVHAVAKHPFETQEAFRDWLLERVHARAGDCRRHGRAARAAAAHRLHLD